MADLRIDEMTGIGADARRGNLLAIQPYMLPADYASAGALSAKLGGYLETARQAGWLNPFTIAVFPEYIGTWLVVACDVPEIYQASDIDQAMRRMMLRHPIAFINSYLKSKEKDRLIASVFRVQPARVAQDYQSVFSILARHYGVTLVGGSILLPNPSVKHGQVTAGTGPLYNVSAVFKPDGTVFPNLSFKAFPISEELGYISPAPDQNGPLPVYDTLAGRLGVLVCADSWYPAMYERLKAQKVDFVAVPSFATGNDQWDIPWGGYSGADAPGDVDYKDVGRLTEGQAWQKYALPGRMSLSGARAGVNVFLHGSLWDLGSDSGCSLVINASGATETRAKGGAILNLWL